MSGNDNNDPLMTVDEVAAYLSLAVGTVYNKVNRGEIPHLKIGRALRFRRHSIEEWVEDQDAKAKAGERGEAA